MGMKGVWAISTPLDALLLRAVLFEGMCSPSTNLVPILQLGL